MNNLPTRTFPDTKKDSVLILLITLSYLLNLFAKLKNIRNVVRSRDNSKTDDFVRHTTKIHKFHWSLERTIM